MAALEAWQYAHVVLFALWVAATLGGLLSVRGPSETAGRLALVLMLPVGYSLAGALGVARMPDTAYAILWAVALAWGVLVLASTRSPATQAARRLARIERGWRMVLAAGLLWDAWQGFAGRGHLLAPWVSGKFVLYALILAASLVVDAAGTAHRRRRVAYAAILGCLLAAAWLGVAKPSFG